jgi:hypothetical protein
MKFSLKLLESDTEIRSQILNAMKSDLDAALTATARSIKQDIFEIVKDALETEPEFSSLIAGELRKEFGIQDTSNVQIAVNNIANSIIIDKTPVSINNTGISGGLKISIINNRDYGGALGDASALVVDDQRGYSLPWLEWLLLKGNQIIVRDFSVKFGSNANSRSGDAIMVPSSSSWRVPPEFAGTITDNWTTRALSKIDDKITNIIQTVFVRNL